MELLCTVCLYQHGPAATPAITITNGNAYCRKHHRQHETHNGNYPMPPSTAYPRYNN